MELTLNHFPIRKIIHIDMDAFFASVEQLDFPELKGKPIAVGGSEERGVVAAASYEARKFGVRSAISGVQAKKLCPHLIFMPPRFSRYKEISAQIKEIFFRYTDLVEPLSLDEAYLDVTTNKTDNPSATLIAQQIRNQILTEIGLTASAGISVNKFLAKIASDFNKPNGQKTITAEEAQPFLDNLEINKFHGIGKVTTQKMYQCGIFTGYDLRQKSVEFLEKHFGNSATYYFQLARGIHLSEVNPVRIIKSLATEHTYPSNITSEIYLEEKLIIIANELANRLKIKQLAGKTITLKIKYSNFKINTRSKTILNFINSENDLFFHARELLYQKPLENSVRLMGISVSNLNNQEKSSPKYVQLSLEFP